MTISFLLTITLFLLFVFQGLQIYFFKQKQMLYGSVFVVFFWSILSFLVYNLHILFSVNGTAGSQIQPRSIIIEKGSTLSHIADQLLGDGIITNKNHLLWTAKMMGLENRLQAGKYSVAPYMSNFALIKQLTSGSSVQIRVTIIEGITAQDIASLLSHELEIDSTKIMNIVNDSVQTKNMGINAPNLEGFLYPETYQFNWGLSEREVVGTLVEEFKKHVPDSVYTGMRSFGMNLHELVTLASLIEGEAVVDDERTLISAVFHNRLKKNMRLEADPTIQYIIPDGPRRLLIKDLELDSPYNTYKYKGLPPGPINNPGVKSLIAAAFPAPETYLYFVATGDGRHTFTRTLAEHLEAKKILDRMRREIRKNSNFH